MASTSAVGQLSTILEHLQQDRDLLVYMSLAAQQRFFDFPTWEQTTGTIRTFLKQFSLDWSPHEPVGA